MSTERCGWCAAHVVQTEAPIGPACGAPAVELIHWRDGRVSAACADHGLSSLDPEGAVQVRAVERIGAQ